MKIKYISWFYGKTRRSVLMGYEPLHLIRLEDGRGLLYTTEECMKLGLCQ